MEMLLNTTAIRSQKFYHLYIQTTPEAILQLPTNLLFNSNLQLLAQRHRNSASLLPHRLNLRRNLLHRLIDISLGVVRQTQSGWPFADSAHDVGSVATLQSAGQDRLGRGSEEDQRADCADDAVEVNMAPDGDGVAEAEDNERDDGK